MKEKYIKIKDLSVSEKLVNFINGKFFTKTKIMKQLIIASTSTLHSGQYLDYLLDDLKIHFKNIDDIVFIPYARPSGITHDEYTKKAAKAFQLPVIKKTPFIDFVLNLQNGQMGDKNGQMGKNLKGENGKISKKRYNRL